MRREVVVGMSCAILLAGAVAARALDERELTPDELRTEMVRNHALAAYIERNGPPDLAESHFLSDEPPWDDREVTLYYLDRRKEIGFSRAWILGRPEVHIPRYERGLTDEQVRALSSRVRAHPLAIGGGPVERAELAARRAEDAAGRVETAAAAAERAADRAESVASKMEGAFHRALRK
jgi:hypothetical protein